MYVVLARDAHLGVAVKDWFDRKHMGLTEVVAVAAGQDCLLPIGSVRPSALVLVARAADAVVMGACRAVAELAEASFAPFVVALGEADESARIAVLDAGADAVVHPFALKAIEWRVVSLCERVRVAADVHGRDVTVTTGSAVLAGRRVALTALESAILKMLVRSPDRVIGRTLLERQLWGEVKSRTLDVHVARLRRKLGAFGRRIETVRKVGYRYTDNTPRSRALS